MKPLPRGVDVHEEVSPRRAAFLLAPQTSDGRISHNPREKVDVLSLKKTILKLTVSPPPFHVFFPFSNVGDDTIALLSFSNLKQFQNDLYVFFQF